ncbi:Uncharacterised protein [Sphingobacterium multivorum]|uniref:Uncharacterized protein n=1 Tax=Sphingobacterium multivorum TaxID=28454 RepID=A0A2X2LGZ3_SPHMU|nr:Uncharacterised protein [Sphingobacterium multivorum]
MPPQSKKRGGIKKKHTPKMTGLAWIAVAVIAFIVLLIISFLLADIHTNRSHTP